MIQFLLFLTRRYFILSFPLPFLPLSFSLSLVSPPHSPLSLSFPLLPSFSCSLLILSPLPSHLSHLPTPQLSPSPLRNRVGTLRWTAPEVLRSESYSFKSDVFSFGLVMWEMWARELPFLGESFDNRFGAEGYLFADFDLFLIFFFFDSYLFSSLFSLLSSLLIPLSLPHSSLPTPLFSILHSPSLLPLFSLLLPSLLYLLPSLSLRIEDAIMSGERPEIPPECPEVWANIIQTCWADEPTSRPSLREVMLKIRSSA